MGIGRLLIVIYFADFGDFDLNIKINSGWSSKVVSCLLPLTATYLVQVTQPDSCIVHHHVHPPVQLAQLVHKPGHSTQEAIVSLI